MTNYKTTLHNTYPNQIFEVLSYYDYCLSDFYPRRTPILIYHIQCKDNKDQFIANKMPAVMWDSFLARSPKFPCPRRTREDNPVNLQAVKIIILIRCSHRYLPASFPVDCAEYYGSIHEYEELLSLDPRPPRITFEPAVHTVYQAQFYCYAGNILCVPSADPDI